MLQSIRDHTQGWIAGIIISLLILSFALWGIHSYLVGSNVHNTVAKVNGVEITKSQLAVAYERLRRQLQAQYNNSQLPPNIESTLKARSLQALINFEVLKQASLSEGYRVSQRQVESFLFDMPEFQVKGQFSLARFQQILATTVLSANEFIDLIKNTLLIDQPRLGMIFTSFALPNEVSGSMALVGQKRSISYVILPLQYFANQPITITEEQINQYYHQHQDKFKTEEQASIEFIELSMKDIASKIHPTDEELKNFYNENTNSFAQPAQWKLERLLIPLDENATEQQVAQAGSKINEAYKKAKEGKDFASLAHDYSLVNDNKLSKKWVNINQLSIEAQKSMITLTRPGDLSQSIRKKNGFELLKVDDYKPMQVLSYDQAKAQVTEAYVNQKAEEQFANLREKLANLVYEHPTSLTPAAKELGLNIQASGLFTREKGAKDISANNKIREVAFSDDVLNLQNNSEVVSNATDSAIVIRIKSHVPASMLVLKTVKPQIIDKIKANEINKKAFQLAHEIQVKLQEGERPDQIAAEYHLKWEQVGLIERHSNNVESALIEAAFAMPKPGNKITYAVAKISSGYAIIGLKAVQDGASNNLDQYRLFSEQTQNSQGLLEYELYKQSLMKQAKIEVQGP